MKFKNRYHIQYNGTIHQQESCLTPTIESPGEKSLFKPSFLKKLLFCLPLGLILAMSLALLPSCERDEEFMFDINDLIETQWGIPQVIEPGEGHIDLDAPTVFFADGLVTIGAARTDFWSIRGSRSIILQQSQQVWFIIDLSPDRLYVEKSTHPDGRFIVKCLYEPLRK